MRGSYGPRLVLGIKGNWSLLATWSAAGMLRAELSAGGGFGARNIVSPCLGSSVETMGGEVYVCVGRFFFPRATETLT